MAAGSSPSEAPAERVLEITRLFDAPRELVFRAWTEPEQVRSWTGPRGFTAPHAEHDLRPGGAWRACLRPEDGGRDLWQGGVFKEVAPPERLVFTFAWDQEDGSPGHETEVTVTFAERDGRTLMTFRQALFETVEQRDAHAGGWNSCFDRLAEHLAAA